MAARGHKAGGVLPPVSEEESGFGRTGESAPDDGDAPVTEKEPDAVKDLKPGELDAAIGDLGDAVARENSKVDLSEEGHRNAIEAMENLGDSLDLDPSSLVAGVRDFLLDVIKHRPKPWSATSQAEQRDVAAACEQLADGLVRQIVEVIRADGKEPVRVLLEKVMLGGDSIQISGKVKTLEAEEEDRAVMMLHHARGKHVLLTVASVDDYKGEHRPAETQPDERELPFEAGDHPEDDSDLLKAAEELVHVETRINLKTGMVEGRELVEELGNEDGWEEVREAMPEELAAERERVADFDKSETRGEAEEVPA